MIRWSLGLSIAAVVLATIALAVSGHVAGMAWGSVSGWVGGVGSLAAAVVALGLGLDSTRKYRRDQQTKAADARDRAARRAKRVRLRATGQLGGGKFNRLETLAYGAGVMNDSGSPVYDFQWHPPVVVIPPVFGNKARVYCATTAMLSGTETMVLNAEPRVLEPGHESNMSVEGLQSVQGQGDRSLTLAVFPVVAFDDDDGNRFGWTIERKLDIDGKTLELTGRWDFVDDNYPYECTGVLRELFDQAEGGPHSQIALRRRTKTSRSVPRCRDPHWRRPVERRAVDVERRPVHRVVACAARPRGVPAAVAEAGDMLDEDLVGTEGARHCAGDCCPRLDEVSFG
jgi:hypothetical protein